MGIGERGAVQSVVWFRDAPALREFVLRILAKPKAGDRNLHTGLLYSAIERGQTVRVAEWTPARMLFGAYEVLHLHWPENVLNDRLWPRAAAKVLLLLLALAWVRILGRKVLWTMHNLQSQYRFHPKTEQLFWRLFIRALSGVICLSEESLSQLRRLRKAATQLPSLVVPHGTYRGVYPNAVTRQEARKRLSLAPDAQVVLNLGILRSHKNLERLIELGRERADIEVLIAGFVRNADYGTKLRALARGLPNVHLHLQFLDDQDLQYFLKAADLFVLPYDQVTNSGSSILALSFGLPVLAPDLPCFKTLRQQFGKDWVATYAGDLDAGKVQSRLSSGRLGPDQEIDWDGWEWDEIAPKVQGFLETLCAR